jgi:shikimate kinase
MISSRTNLILIGYMGSGKSSLGRVAARELGFRFVDTDALVVQQAGFDIPTIFALHGEAYFREQETKAIESLAEADQCVISTGGGAVLAEKNRELLREIGFVVLLTAREEVIWDRVSRNTKRPLLRTANPRETISRMLAERMPIYEATAHFTVDSSDLSRDETLREVLDAAHAAWTRA